MCKLIPAQRESPRQQPISFAAYLGPYYQLSHVLTPTPRPHWVSREGDMAAVAFCRDPIHASYSPGLEGKEVYKKTQSSDSNMPNENKQKSLATSSAEPRK